MSNFQTKILPILTLSSAKEKRKPKE